MWGPWPGQDAAILPAHVPLGLHHAVAAPAGLGRLLPAVQDGRVLAECLAPLPVPC